MYSFVLFSHSILRWAVLLLAIYLVGRSAAGWIRSEERSDSEGRLGTIYAGIVDLQFLLGLILYLGLSPIMKAVFSDFGAAMQNDELRFFAVEHLPFMIIGTAFAHIGSRVDKRDTDAKNKWRSSTIWFGLSLATFLAGIPWFRPFLPF